MPASFSTSPSALSPPAVFLMRFISMTLETLEIHDSGCDRVSYAVSSEDLVDIKFMQNSFDPIPDVFEGNRCIWFVCRDK